MYDKIVIVEDMTWPDAVHYYARLGLIGKGRALKKLIVCLTLSKKDSMIGSEIHNNNT